MDLTGVGVWSSQLRYGDPSESADAAAELDDRRYGALDSRPDGIPARAMAMDRRGRLLMTTALIGHTVGAWPPSTPSFACSTTSALPRGDGHPIAQTLQDLVEGTNDTPPLPAGPALDLGCGTGDSSIYLVQHGWKVTGVDFVPKALDKC